MSKRGHGEGSISKRANGTWFAQVTLDGRRLSKTHKTRKEAQDWIRETTGQIKRGLTFKGASTTYGEFMDEWFRSVKSTLKRTTYDKYVFTYQRYINPLLKDIKLKDLKPSRIQALYTQMEDSDVGTWTIRKAHTIIHKSLQQALRVGYITRNPASVAIAPATPKTEMQVLDASQVSQLLIAAKGTRLEAILHVAIATGLRQMELLGLRWTDLEWSKKTIKIQRQLNRGSVLDPDYSKPKTSHGMRLLALGDSTIEVLRNHYERQQMERQFAGDQWTENNLIFPSSVGTPWHSRNLLRDFKKLLESAGLPSIRFHDLRHTAASLILNHGVPVIIVSRRLGHSRPSITMDVYGHLIPGMQQEAADLIDELITPVQIGLDDHTK